jgi:hypothetical protein
MGILSPGHSAMFGPIGFREFSEDEYQKCDVWQALALGMGRQGN